MKPNQYKPSFLDSEKENINRRNRIYVLILLEVDGPK